MTSLLMVLLLKSLSFVRHCYKTLTLRPLIADNLMPHPDHNKYPMLKNECIVRCRGSYPPINSRYSYDLRTLVAELFRRSPRSRPSINSILRKPFIQPLTEKFLTPEQHHSEFSHTVLHKHQKPPSSAVGYNRPSSAGYLHSVS